MFPWETGSPVTKSNEMSDQGLDGMGSGCNSPVRALEEDLLRAQTEQASTYSRTSDSIAGHQNLREMTYMARLTPGWHESSEV